VPAVADEFAEHTSEEQEHADRFAERIFQLVGSPDLNPATLVGRAHSEYTTAPRLIEMIKENLVAERVAMASYTEIINWLDDGDVTTRRLFEDVHAVEEEHADDMLTFLEQMARAPRTARHLSRRSADPPRRPRGEVRP